MKNVQDILKLKDCQVFQQSFNRRNIIYQVRQKSTSKKIGGSDSEGNSQTVVAQIAQWIQATYPNQCGIIYCSSKKDCEEVAAQLASTHRLSVDYYHAGMDPVARQRVQDSWAKDQTRIICATIAFGQHNIFIVKLWNHS